MGINFTAVLVNWNAQSVDVCLVFCKQLMVIGSCSMFNVSVAFSLSFC